MIELKNLKELAKNFRVLYVEDDSSIQLSMSSYLRKLFLEVVTANDGLQGLEAYKNAEFDIVITDISMPNMDGLEMIKNIKEINESQTILITTAYSSPEYMFKSIKLGVEGYIIKPIDYEQLNSELYKIVDKLKKFQENIEYKTSLEQMVEKKTLALNEMIQAQKDDYDKTLLSMVEMIESRDAYTAGHSKRVAQYCEMIAREMGYSEEDCKKIYQAGILHDIGKIATPDTVLLNPKTLNDIEYKLIQEHVKVSFKILSDIPMFNYLAQIVYAHHERFDGKGYPRGLSGDDINPLSHIMIVADAFDAMTTNRIYKPRKNVQEAIAELIELKSKQFHPKVVEHAAVALKDVKLNPNINQLPKTLIEKERFSYFYKDVVCDVYNQSYLEVVMMKNSYEKTFKYMDFFYLENFSSYNKKNGWHKGDKLLHNVAICLRDYFKDSYIFRIFGDDFAVLSMEKQDTQKLKFLLDEIIKESGITYFQKNIDLSKVIIDSASTIENIYNT